MTIRTTAPIAAAALLLVLTGCVANSPSEGATTLTVTSSADACDVSAHEAPAGTLTFEVKNTGDEETEFYLLAADGERVVSEVEDIGPGLTRNLVLDAKAGDYFTACKPGMTGDGVGTAKFTVTD